MQNSISDYLIDGTLRLTEIMNCSARISFQLRTSWEMPAREYHPALEELSQQLHSKTSIRTQQRSSRMLSISVMRLVTSFPLLLLPTTSTLPKLTSSRSTQLRKRPASHSRSQSTWLLRSRPAPRKPQLNTRPCV